LGKVAVTKTRNVLVRGTAASLLVLILAGCSSLIPGLGSSNVDGSAQHSTAQDQALDKYVGLERAQISKILAATPGVYSDVRIEARHPDSILYTYTYAKQVDQAKAATYFDSMAPTFQKSMDSAVFPAMRKSGLHGVLYAIYTYINADGSLIWTKEFASS
jgi:hypothetical protein